MLEAKVKRALAGKVMARIDHFTIITAAHDDGHPAIEVERMGTGNIDFSISCNPDIGQSALRHAECPAGLSFLIWFPCSGTANPCG